MLCSSRAAEELEALSKIISAADSAADCAVFLDQMTIRLNEVFPFQRCVVVHERTRGGVSTALVHRVGRAPEQSGGAVRHSSRGAAVGVAAYLGCFDTSGHVDHAFHWVGTARMPVQASPRLGELVGHMGGGQGIGACVRSDVADGEQLSTLLQLACAGTSERPMLMLSVFAGFLHATLAAHAMTSPSPPASNFPGVSLTGKERDVIRWVVEGKTSWEIGRILFTSERTVKFHLKNVYTKLNVSNRAQAVAVVNRLRLI